jgi:serine protease inhibitor
VNIESKCYGRKDVSLSQKFDSNMDYHYDTKFEQLDFENKVEAANTINSWIMNVTNGKISDLVDSESLSNAVVLLINAVYFQGLWLYPFEDFATKEFHADRNTKHKKEFVEQTRDFVYYYSKELQAKLLRLPYHGDKYSMVLILPFEIDGLQNIINNLDSDVLEKEVSKMEEITVHVALPKFKFDTSMNLNSIVKKVSLSFEHLNRMI